MDRNAGARITPARDRLAAVHGAADAVLGREERREPHPRRAVQHVGRVPPVARDGGVVGDEPHALPPHQVQRVAQQDLQPRNHLLRGRLRGTCGRWRGLDGRGRPRAAEREHRRHGQEGERNHQKRLHQAGTRD
jgi:hypothetical protein